MDKNVHKIERKIYLCDSYFNPLKYSSKQCLDILNSFDQSTKKIYELKLHSCLSLFAFKIGKDGL